MQDFRRVAVLGSGVIGSSWSALFATAGYAVSIYEPVSGNECTIRDFVSSARKTIGELGLLKDRPVGELTFHPSAASAVENADFVQESIPEKLPLKHKLYSSIEPALKGGVIVASSASGLQLSELQTGWRDPSRLVLGHPFNPPHLIPLVEVMSNEHTAQGAVECAERFYRSLGKVTIRVNREVPGHVANRLQAALWREAIHLLLIGAATVKDIDTAIWAGPGLRWAAMGPTMLFHLGAGDGGLNAFCERYAESFHRWWDDLGTVKLDPPLIARLTAGVMAESGARSQADLRSERDALIIAMLKATSMLRQA
jgi:3-hydroxybutyryl-CoA dehydrogenase